MTPIKNQMTSIKGWKQLLNFSTPLLTGEKVNGDKIKKKKKRRSRKLLCLCLIPGEILVGLPPEDVLRDGKS